MKLLIVSDIHGSAYYAKKIIDAYAIHTCSHILLLGDLLYHGPRNPLPKQYDPQVVTATLNPYQDKIIAIRGNCDAEVDQMVLTFPITNDYNIIPLGNQKIFATHGHIYSPSKLPPLQANDIFIFGHIHVPVMEKVDGIHMINPGSITLPKENTAHSYIVFEKDTFTLYNENHTILQTYTI